MRQVSTRYFNSRPLTRSTHNDFLHLIESDISTHDLLRGRLLSLSVRGRSMLFQLTTSYEVDLSFSPSLLILLYFNSRPLTRSTLTLQHRTAGLCISTHDLLRGRLRSLERSYQSLHHFNSRPLTRSTGICWENGRRQRHFNSRPLTRSTRTSLSAVLRSPHFNSRPLTRSTKNLWAYGVHEYISTHDLLRGRLTFQPHIFDVLHISTHDLLRGRLVYRLWGYFYTTISTHDLLRGRLSTGTVATVFFIYFNSRPLTRSTHFSVKII